MKLAFQTQCFRCELLVSGRVVITKIWSNHSNHGGSCFVVDTSVNIQQRLRIGSFFKYSLAVLLCFIHYNMNLEFKKMPTTEEKDANKTPKKVPQATNSKWTTPDDGQSSGWPKTFPKKTFRLQTWKNSPNSSILLFVFFFFPLWSSGSSPRHFWVDDDVPTFLGGDVFEIFPGRYAPFFWEDTLKEPVFRIPSRV